VHCRPCLTPTESDVASSKFDSSKLLSTQ
jgi:hypothetical protein